MQKYGVIGRHLLVIAVRSLECILSIVFYNSPYSPSLVHCSLWQTCVCAVFYKGFKNVNPSIQGLTFMM